MRGSRAAREAQACSMSRCERRVEERSLLADGNGVANAPRCVAKSVSRGEWTRLVTKDYCRAVLDATKCASCRLVRELGQRALLTLVVAGASAVTAACTTVDPGPNFVVESKTFDPDFFFCHVEPELLFAKGCGSGDSGRGESNSCHFNSSAVSGMALVSHAPVDCGGGNHPVDRTQIGSGSPAQGNLQAASLEMNTDYLTAPIYVRPLGNNHPRAIFASDDPVVDVIRQWSQK